MTNTPLSTQHKRLYICLPAAGPGADGHLTAIDIDPATTAADILAQLRLVEHWLSPVGPDVIHLDGEVTLWPHVQSDQKVAAVPRGDVGAQPIVRIIKSVQAVSIPPRSVTLHHVRNWRPHPSNSNLLVGTYRGLGKRLVPGYIKIRGGDAGNDNPSFYMVTPPRSLLNGSHAPCFRKRDENVYWVHFNNRSMSIDAGIAAIELQLQSCNKGSR